MRRLMVAIAAAAAVALILGVAFAGAESPTVTIEDASSVAYTSAVAKGTVDPQGKETNCHFEYVSQAQLEENLSNGGGEFDNGGGADCSGNPHNGSGPPAQDVEADLTGLSPSTVYHLRLVASNEDGQSEAVAANTFETEAAGKPAVSIDPITTFTATTAHFGGSINPNAPVSDPGFQVNWHFECNPGCPGAEGPALGTGNTSQPVEFDATGLEPNTNYTVKLTAESPGGSESAGPISFKTVATGPDAETVSAFALGSSTEALLGGKVNPHNSATSYWFEWGTADCTVNPCQETPHVPAVNDEVQRLTVAGEAGTFNVSFEGQTTADLPFDITVNGVRSALEGLSTIGAGNVSVSGTRAFLSGPGVFRVTFLADFAGTDVPELSGASGTPPLSGGAGGIHGASVETLVEGGSYANQDIFVAPKLTGLTPATTYHFRLVAESGSGASQGEDISFETPPPAEPIESNCPNAKLRTETNSATLPECRAYELTTEPDKNANDVRYVSTTSADGNRLAYYSSGAYGDAAANANWSSYIAQRGPSGWTTRSLMPKVEAPGLGAAGAYSPADPSVDLSTAVVMDDRDTAEEPNVNNILLVKPGSSPIWVTAPTVPGAEIFHKNYAGRSADASHIFFESSQEFVPGAANGHNQIWEWFDGKVSLISVEEDGSPFPNGGTVGNGYNGSFEPGQPSAVSADGSRVFFAGTVGFGAAGIYVREDGLHTRPVSVSQRAGSVGDFDGSANFVGAASDGSVVYLSSEKQLTNDATPGGGLYCYNLETDEMHFVGAGALSPGRLLISDDGRRIYFISPKLLVPGKGVEGARNVYTANDEGGELTFVATVEPGDLDFADNRQHSSFTSYVSATSDGGKLVFDSTARLTAFDNVKRRELYLYDASSGSLRCLSCRPDGRLAEGDATLRYLGIEETSSVLGRPRGLTSDGSAVFFESADGLVPEDVNGLLDVYEYRNGRVSLISTGTSAYHSQIMGSSPDGKNIFFTTHDRLVGQDIDGNKDVYDARVDGGFPAPPPPVSLCEGEACQGQAHGAPAYTSPGTASLMGRGNTDGRTKKRTHGSCGRKSKKQHSKCGKKTKKHKSKKQQAKKASKSGRGE